MSDEGNKLQAVVGQNTQTQITLNPKKSKAPKNSYLK